MKIEQKTIEIGCYLYFCDDIADIAINVLSRIDKSGEDIYDDVYQAMDDELIYTEDQWSVMKHYQTPQEADFNKAWELFAEDLVSCIYKIMDLQHKLK